MNITILGQQNGDGTGGIEMSKIIIIITVIGTDKNIPNIPQMAPQSAKAIRMTKGLRFRDFPRNLGSTILPITNSTVTMPEVMIKNGTQL